MEVANGSLYLCKYQIGSLVFMMGGEKIIMDHSNVLSMEQLNDYEMNLRSVFKITLRIDIRKKIWLLKNKKDIICKFELDKIGMDPDYESYATSSGIVWNDEFGIYFNDDDETTDTKAMEDRISLNEGDDFQMNNIETESYHETQNTLDVFLFNQKLLDASNRVVNHVYTKNTMQQIAGRVISASKHPKVLMSRFENNEVYQELLLPANPAYKTLMYLDQYYGFYRKGAIIFYDMDILYLINSSGKCTAKQPGEKPETTFLVTKLDSGIPGNGMLRANGELVNYVVLTEDCVNAQKFSEGENAESGGSAKIIVSDDTTINIAEANSSIISQRNEKIGYTKKDDNKFSANIAKARMDENEYALFITGNNLDISAFTPNKTYQIFFDETGKHEKYGHEKYRLVYAYHFFKAESDIQMSSSHRLILKKIASDDDITTVETEKQDYTKI